MKLVFQTRPGQVVKLDDPAAQCQTRLLKLTPDITFESERSIVTRFTVSSQVNVQFLHSLGALIYIYVFGDRIGQVSLSGLSFGCTCPDGDELGAEKMMQWYKVNRASKRAEPVEVAIGSVVIRGFVTSFSEDLVDPSISLVQWGVNMNALPFED